MTVPVKNGNAKIDKESAGCVWIRVTVGSISSDVLTGRHHAEVLVNWQHW